MAEGRVRVGTCEDLRNPVPLVEHKYNVPTLSYSCPVAL